MINAQSAIIFTAVSITLFPHFLKLAGIPRNIFLGKLSGLQIIQQNLTQHELQRKEPT